METSQTEDSWPTVLKFIKIHEFYQLFTIRKKFVYAHLC